MSNQNSSISQLIIIEVKKWIELEANEIKRLLFWSLGKEHFSFLGWKLLVILSCFLTLKRRLEGTQIYIGLNFGWTTLNRLSPAIDSEVLRQFTTKKKMKLTEHNDEQELSSAR